MAGYSLVSVNGAVPDTQAVTEALARAAATAGHAPSIHNTQPWRWRLTGDTLDLLLERSRVSEVTDSDGRLATLSCGAALHHARIALAATGWKVEVTRIPDPATPAHLARLHIERGRADPYAVQRMQAILVRHTDRSLVTGDPAASGDIAAITKSVAAQAGRLQMLHCDQLFDLSVAAADARRTQTPESPWHDELAYWTGGSAPRPETLPIGVERDLTAVFGMLCGPGDQSIHWLRAGEALSAGWLTATERGITVLPLSAAIEVPATREVMRGFVTGDGYPYLVLRLGTSPDGDRPPLAARQPVDQIIERL